MNTTKKLGIWMDHSTGHLMEFTADNIETKIIDSKFTHGEKEKSLHKNENLAHNKEQHQQSEFYKLLGNVIRTYDDVVIFGPTDAKSELFNTLRTDHNFDKIKIVVRQAAKMTEGQQHAFVREYFSHTKTQ